MPIFRAGNSVINLPEGSSYIVIGSPDTAEWRVCGICNKGSSGIGKKYKISCENGKLITKEIEED